MSVVRTIVLGLALLPVLVSPVAAHSLAELEQQLFESEQYFQPVDLPAPDFALQDAEGRPVRLTDFRGKVVVLNFIYTNCGDVCPLHSVLIAQLQSMINAAPMKDRVAFISITTDPKNDTGTVLADYGESHGLDQSTGPSLPPA